MILFFKRYFGKDWKFFWTTNPIWDFLIQIPCDFIGFKLLILSRKLMRIGAKRCSWCGEKQNRNTGLHMHASKKGFRCGNTPKQCCDKPYV